MELITRDCDIFDPKTLPGWRAVLCSRQTEQSWLYQYDFTVPQRLLCLGCGLLSAKSNECPGTSAAAVCVRAIQPLTVSQGSTPGW